MIRFVAAAVLSLLILACTPPDRWGAFDVEWQEKLEHMHDEKVAVTEDLRPKWDNPPVVSLGEGETSLAIEQAAILALQNNRDLGVQQLNPIIAGTFEDIERGVFDPELFAGFEYFEERASQTDRATQGQFSVEGRDTEGEVGISQYLPTGTTVEASVGQQRNASNRSPEQQIARGELSVTQNLLEGFGPAVNLVAVRQAELDTLRSVYELRRFTESLLAETEITYWRYTLAAREIAIFEESLAISKRQRDEIEQRIEVGVLAETEGAAARAEVALREQALIDARSNLEQQRVRLLRLINPDDGDLSRDITAASNPEIDAQPITDLEDRLRLAEQMRPDLNEARLRLRQNRLETIATRNGLLPDLELFLVVGKTGFDNTFVDSFDNINRNTYDFTVGASYTQQLGNREAKARHRGALASRQQAAAAVSNLQQLIRMDVRLAANEVERARQQIAATAATSLLQKRTVEAEQERFNVGSSTALLVAQAQRDLLSAQIAEVGAIVGYRIALVNLYFAEGSLLERRGVRIAGSTQAVAR